MRTHRLLLVATSVVTIAAACGGGGGSLTGTLGTGASPSGAASTGSATGGAAASTTGAGAFTSSSTTSSAASNGSTSNGSTSNGSTSTGSPSTGSGSSGGGSSTGGSSSSTASVGSTASGSTSAASGSGSSSSGVASTSSSSASSSSSGAPTLGSTCTAPSTTTLTGTVYAPNGKDPIPNVRVYVPIMINPYPATYCDQCSAPIDPAYVATFTAADGTFSLDIDNVPEASSITFAIQIGRFRKWTTLPVTACTTETVPLAAETLPGASGPTANIPKIAVSSGNVDHLDVVLTTLGITEFDCYEGRANPYYPYAGGGSCTSLSASSPTIASVLASNEIATSNYNMAFLSCAPDAYATFSKVVSASAMTTNTAAWVTAGGRLFVTDTAYDYIAQPFPAPITWAGPAGTPQPVDGANTGCAPANTSFANAHAVLYPTTINDPTLAAWLQLPAIGFTSSPNVQIQGFYEPWSAMASLATTTSLIATGTMMPMDPTYPSTLCKTPTIESVPLTAEYDVSNCGRVIFSSYHTYTGTGASATAANEKIMEFLIFAAATCSKH